MITLKYNLPKHSKCYKQFDTEKKWNFCVVVNFPVILLGMRINFPNNYKCIIEGKIKREISFKKGQLGELVG